MSDKEAEGEENELLEKNGKNHSKSIKTNVKQQRSSREGDDGKNGKTKVESIIRVSER